MIDIKKHIINQHQPLRSALIMLNELGEDLTLFVVDNDGRLIGTLTDGDTRRGLLNGLGVSDSVVQFMEETYRFIYNHNYKIKEITDAKEKGVEILPVVDEYKRIIHLINFSKYKSYLPISAVIMAGGEGIRLRPLTDNLPKPLLEIGGKPIIEYGIDWLMKYGINDFKISINYLGEKIVNHFGDGSAKNISVLYINEKDKLGTIGSVSLVDNYKHDFILVMNSDLLTSFDLEECFIQHESKNADMSVASIPYNVNIPYAIMDTDHENILSFKEKPTITYHSNAGIYLIKKEHLKRIPQNRYFNATDLIDNLIGDNKKVIYYPILGYWLDIGKMDDYKKAQEDIRYIKF